MVMERIFGSCESFFVTDTLQFDDYAKYVAPRFESGSKEGTAQRAGPRWSAGRRRRARGPAGEAGTISKITFFGIVKPTTWAYTIVPEA